MDKEDVVAEFQKNLKENKDKKMHGRLTLRPTKNLNPYQNVMATETKAMRTKLI
jgi:hypothetical protein